MVIVVAIVIVLITMVVPAASSLWRERRISDAQNTISGQLMSARARALQGEHVQGDSFALTDPANPANPRRLLPGGESGLFFFVDGDGVQRIAAIVQTMPEDRTCLGDDGGACIRENRAIRESWANVFTVVPGRVASLPAPMRVVPRHAVCDPPVSGVPTCQGYDLSYELFSKEELAHTDVYTTAGDQAQRHRNFFTMIYSTDGQLVVDRDVLIRDVDEIDEAPGEQTGDVTGLKVLDEAEVRNYFPRTDVTPTTLQLSPASGPYEGIEIVAEDGGTALNFSSVDGLLVYDESSFAAWGDDKQRFFLENAWPFYVHRLTGAVIRGPVGEAVATGP
jgi:hypothetical protein